MTREELIRELEALIERALRQNDTMPAAAVLSALQGALLIQADVELMHIVAQFSRECVRAIKSTRN